MDAQQQPVYLTLRTTLLTLLITTLLCSNSWFISANPVTISKDVNKVTLELYYESLCPYCSRFIVNHLYKLFESGIIDITDLKLIPYGNAKLKPNNTIICQHGPYECLLNNVEACAIDVWPQADEHFPFIYCVESLVYQGKYTQWETCFETLGLDPQPVTDCYNSGRALEARKFWYNGFGYGNPGGWGGKRIEDAMLELKYAAETNDLQPPHKYVPWVVVNGQPLYDDYENFLNYICNAYEGTAVPSTCREFSVSVIQEKESNLIKPVCYTEVKSKLSDTRAAIISWINQLISLA